MEKRFSEMTDGELKQQIADLKIKIQKSEQMGMINEVAVHERKMAMAEAYLMDPEDFHPGEVYFIQYDERVPFKIDYMNGVFAWGYRGETTELSAFPISLLEKVTED
ncbi:recombinational DNA repair protein RecT [Pullulanibacillus pueri]|uniref:DUF1811 family protein n=1 Tax=Pullulanibacillus pueri TaxID=1437324 RepID=A0A8J3ENT6_9BACL|nr:YfhH family protein [Pullulanibacillus pueri]MBM7680703.1 recombinational DNA repair protein RecT [Pullulanibacillus pueri]GGH87552.1 hypothetical protein GCM10007096_37830 [Pullulanibacillus pueri]